MDHIALPHCQFLLAASYSTVCFLATPTHAITIFGTSRLSHSTHHTRRLMYSPRPRLFGTRPFSGLLANATPGAPVAHGALTLAFLLPAHCGDRPQVTALPLVGYKPTSMPPPRTTITTGVRAGAPGRGVAKGNGDGQRLSPFSSPARSCVSPSTTPCPHPH